MHHYRPLPSQAFERRHRLAPPESQPLDVEAWRQRAAAACSLVASGGAAAVSLSVQLGPSQALEVRTLIVDAAVGAALLAHVTLVDGALRVRISKRPEAASR